MLLICLYAALIALILWSVYYIIRRIVRSFRGGGTCSCGCSGCRKSCCTKDANARTGSGD